MPDASVVSYSVFRDNLKSYCNQVIDNAQALYITRKENRNVVAISEDEWNSIQETLFFLNDENRMQRLSKSEQNLTEGRTTEYSSVDALYQKTLAHA